MHQGHAHECGYQVVVAAIARAIADEISRVLPQTSGEGVGAVTSPQGLPVTLSVAQAAEVIGIGPQLGLRGRSS